MAVKEILWDRYASNTGAFDLIAEGWNELVQEGATPDRLGICPVTANCQVLYAISEEGDVVGFIAYEEHEVFATAVEILSYVEPSSRRRGVYRALLEDMQRRMKKKGIGRLTSAVPASCKDMLATKRALGGKATSQTFDHEL